MKEHSPFSLNNKTKYELVRYIVELEQRINRAIKILDEATGKEAARAIQTLKGERRAKNGWCYKMVKYFQCWI